MRPIFVVNLIYRESGFLWTIVPTSVGLSQSIYISGFSLIFSALVNGLYNVFPLSLNKNKIIIPRPERLQL